MRVTKKRRTYRFSLEVCGLANHHVMHAAVDTNSQVGEIISITLLNNSNLSEDTVSNEKMQLVATASARHSKAYQEL